MSPTHPLPAAPVFPESRSSARPQLRQGRLISIDVLRGVAALIVLIAHVRHKPVDGKLTLRFFLLLPLDFGTFGVVLFIVLSGFCIHLAVARGMGNGGGIATNWGAFWKRRFWRLYPPYLAALALSGLAYFLSAPATMNSWERVSSWRWDTITHLLMVHNLFEKVITGFGNFPLWTLGLEEQLYLMYPLYLMLRRRFSVTATLAVATALTLTSRYVSLLHDPVAIGGLPFQFRTSCLPFNFWFLWVLGAVAAEAHVGAIKLPRWISSRKVILIFGVLGLGFSDYLLGRFTGSHWLARQAWAEPLTPFFHCLLVSSDLLIALASFGLLRALAEREASRPVSSRVPWLATVGLFSYSLYLVHVPVLHLLETVIRSDDRVSSCLFRYALFVPVCLAVAYAFHRLVEIHFLRKPGGRKTEVRETEAVH